MPNTPETLTPDEYEQLLRIATIASRKIVGRYYPWLLEDATSEALLRAWDSYVKGYDTKKIIWAAQNGALEALRRVRGKTGQKASTLHALSLDADVKWGPDNTPLLDHQGVEDEEINLLLRNSLDQQTIHKIIGWLDRETERKVLWLFYDQRELSVRSIGEILHVTDSRISQCRHSGLQHLAELLRQIRQRLPLDGDFIEFLLSANRCPRCREIRSHEDCPDVRHQCRDCERLPRRCHCCREIRTYEECPNVRRQCCYCKEASRQHKLARRRREWRDARKPRATVPIEEMAVCTVCCRTLPLTSFYIRHDVYQTKRRSRCKECHLFLIRNDNFPPHYSSENKIQFVRHCFDIAWSLDLFPNDLKGERSGHLKFIANQDPVRMTQGLVDKIVPMLPHVPARLIYDWFESPVWDFNPKAWAVTTKRHVVTIERWLHSIYDVGQKLLAESSAATV